MVYQRIIYDEAQRYDLIVEVGENDTCKHIDEVHADALVTESPNVGLMLPIADCVGTVIYDPVQRRLALVHLGRHSTVAGLMFLAVLQIGDDLVDPFANTIHDVPLSAMCRTIEIDLKQAIGDEAPKPLQPENGVLW